MRTLLLSIVLAVLGCAPVEAEVDESEEAESAEDALSSGKNGSACTESPYNCKLRKAGGVKDSAGRYRKKSGTMKFVYGYVLTKPGHKRFGWMAYDALVADSGCP